MRFKKNAEIVKIVLRSLIKGYFISNNIVESYIDMPLPLYNALSVFK